LIAHPDISLVLKKTDLSEVSWLKRLFQAAHTKMDHDPEVWALVERIILDAVRT